ncbi:hypothetical protein HDR60_00025 [bacterium]|nr:hypothetical protein [bacterium]
MQDDTSVSNTSTPTLPVIENNTLLEINEAEIKKAEDEKKEILQTINDNLAKAKNSCIGIMDELKTIQVLAGVSTGASAVGTLTSGGALASGIVKSGKDKKIEEDKEELEKKEERYDELLDTYVNTHKYKDTDVDNVIYKFENFLYNSRPQVSPSSPTGNIDTTHGYNDIAIENQRKYNEYNEKGFQNLKEEDIKTIEHYAKERQKEIKEFSQLLEENKNLQSYIDENCSLCPSNDNLTETLTNDCKLCFDKKFKLNKNKNKMDTLDNNYKQQGESLIFDYSFRSISATVGSDIGISGDSLYRNLENAKEEEFTDVESYMKRYQNPRLVAQKEWADEQRRISTQTLFEEKLKINQRYHNVLETAKNLKKEEKNLIAEMDNLDKEISKNEAVSNLTGNLRTGLLAGSIATSATSTITSGINIKKLDDLITKMKDCDRAVNNLKANVNNAVAEEVDTDLTYYQNVTQSCTGFDTNNIKDIKGVMTASTIVGGVGTVAGTVGTITSAVANTKKTKENAKSTEEGRLNAKALNMTANISAGIATGTSAGGIVLGAVALKKLSDNVDVAEKCEDALK